MFSFDNQCQYRFELNVLSFTEIVQAQFLAATAGIEAENDVLGSCYIHLKCNLGPPPACLDCREIWDGKAIAWMEDWMNNIVGYLNQVNVTIEMIIDVITVRHEYFKTIISVTPTVCMDPLRHFLYLEDEIWCERDSAFRCEEWMGMHSNQFACGDGTCFDITIPSRSQNCMNNRDVSLSESILAYEQHTHVGQH